MKTPYFFLLGAFRDNEVLGNHPLTLRITEISRHHPIEDLLLQPLTVSALNHLLSDTLQQSLIETKELSKLIHQKTAGNPFFVNALLKRFADERQIRFSYEQGKWSWDLEELRRIPVSENVIRFMVQKLRKFSKVTQETLQVAACIGNTFDLKTLIISKQESPTKIEKSLWDAILDGIIVPVTDYYNLAHAQHDDESFFDFQTIYKFQHDRIQQASYSLIENETKEHLHLSIGQSMLQSAKESDTLNENIIEIVRQLNQGIGLVTDEKSKEEIAKLNLKAGERAKASTAYESALEYFEMGCELLTKDCWVTDYELSLSLHQEQCECSYLCGKFDEADKQLQDLLNHVTNKSDRVEVQRMQLIQYTIAGRIEEAVPIGIAALEDLGIILLESPSKMDIIKEKLLAHWNQGFRSIESLIDAKMMDDPNRKKEMQILIDLAVPVYLTGRQSLFVMLVLKLTNIALKYGNSPESAYAYSLYGTILGAAFNDLRTGYRFGKLGFDLNNQLKDTELNCRILFIYAIFIHYWKHPWKTVSKIFEDSIEAGSQSGDVFYMAQSCVNSVAWNSNLNIEESIEQGKTRLEVIQSTKYQDAYNAGRVRQQFRLSLNGQTESSTSLNDGFFDEAECLQEIHDTKYATGVGIYHVCKLVLCVLFRDNEQATQHAKVAKSVSEAIFGIPWAFELCLHSFLAHAALAREAIGSQKIVLLQAMKEDMQQMKKWARHSPSNFGHHFLFMQAEWAVVERKYDKAQSLYRRAAKQSKRSDDIRYSALIHERLAELYLEIQEEAKAKDHLEEAKYHYSVWGAKTKVTDIDQRYSKLFGSQEKRHTNHSLDSDAIIKMTQSLLGETSFEGLLNCLMKIVMENAGAKEATLILKEGEQLLIQAQAKQDGIEPVMQDQPLEETLLPLSLVHYVAHSQKPLVMDDAIENPLCCKDPYIDSKRVHSILCLPLLRVGELVGILYLENKDLKSSFTENHLQTLEHIASTAAMALEISRAKQILEKQVEQRTKDLKISNENQLKLEKILAQKEKMSSLNLTIAGLTHDLATPLYLISSTTQVALLKSHEMTKLFHLKKITEEGLENYLKKQIEFLEHTKLNSKVAFDMISLFQEVSSGVSKNEKKTLQLDSFVESIIKTFQTNKNISFKINFEKMEVLIDPNIIYVIITNLLNNSLIHAYDQGQEGLITIEGKIQGRVLQITYSDDGRGMDQQKKNQVFDPFYTTQGGKGHGLGMTNVYNIIVDLGGSIQCDSSPGKGTSFHMSIPLGNDDEN